MIDPHLRLLRAINLPSPSLASRILHSHPAVLLTPLPTPPYNTALHLAASLGHLTTIECLLSTLPSPSLPPLNGLSQTPLHLACTAGHVHLITPLLSVHPTSLTARDSLGRPPLLAAIIAGHGAEELVAELLDAGADPDEADDEGNTALHYAAAYGDTKAVRILVQAGADPARRNNWSWMPISWSRTVVMEVEFQRIVGGDTKGRVAAGGSGMRAVMDEDGSGTQATTVEVKKPWLEGRPSSPSERPGTPSEGRKLWGLPRPGTPRGRAGSGD